jgi:hypothetical protein
MRTETNELVNDLVNLDRVRSLLKCKADRRRLWAMREEARGSTANHGIIIPLNPSRDPDQTDCPRSARDRRRRRYPIYPTTTSSP